jgi:hypothetical protein
LGQHFLSGDQRHQSRTSQSGWGKFKVLAVFLHLLMVFAFGGRFQHFGLHTDAPASQMIYSILMIVTGELQSPKSGPFQVIAQQCDASGVSDIQRLFARGAQDLTLNRFIWTMTWVYSVARQSYETARQLEDVCHGGLGAATPPPGRWRIASVCPGVAFASRASAMSRANQAMTQPRPATGLWRGLVLAVIGSSSTPLRLLDGEFEIIAASESFRSALLDGYPCKRGCMCTIRC